METTEEVNTIEKPIMTDVTRKRPKNWGNSFDVRISNNEILKIMNA
ncbi:MAG: hypothetical protein QW332_05370 [Thermoproteota archaeon]